MAFLFSLYLNVLPLTINQEYDLQPDEIYISKLMAVAQIENKVGLVVAAGFNFKLFIFDFQSERLKEINDGRLNLQGASNLFVEGSQFKIMSHVPTDFLIYTLKADGQFIDSQPLARFRGWRNGVIPISFRKWSGQRVLLNLLLFETKEIALVDVDLGEKKVDFLLKRSLEDGYSPSWAFTGGQFIEANSKTGEIKLLDAGFDSQKVLLRAFPLVEKKRKPRRPNRSPYAARLRYVHCVDDTCYFQFFDHEGAAAGGGSKVKLLTVTPKDAMISNGSFLPLGSYNGKRLVYDMDAGELAVQTQ